MNRAVLIAAVLAAASSFAPVAVCRATIGCCRLLIFTPRRPPARSLARTTPVKMVEGMSDLPTVLTSFETLDEAQQLLDESGPFAQLFVWPPFYIISILGIIVGMPIATKLRLDSLGDAPTYRNGRY